MFAAFLVWTGWWLWRHRHDADGERRLVERLRSRLPVAPDGRGGNRPWLRDGGRVVLTTGGAALAAIAVVVLILAVDSVPAILAIADDPFVVFEANAVALLGLGPLFFLVAELVERLYYLKAALAALLIMIGLKMAAAELVGKIAPELACPASR